MKKKKYLIGLALAALSMTTLVACGDVTIVNNNGDKTDTPVQENDEITINVENKKYDGEPISVNATAKSKTEVTLEYKLASADDSEYTTDEPIEIGISLMGENVTIKYSPRHLLAMQMVFRQTQSE